MELSLNKARLFWRVAISVALVYSAYVIVLASIARLSTGDVKVTTNSKQAVISLSQYGKSAQIIGTAWAHVRLSPGTYYVFAYDSGRQTDGVVTISKQGHSTLYLDLDRPVGLPTVSEINFENIDSLSNRGISNDQISQLKLLFFQFINRSVKGAREVGVDPYSIQRPPRNPQSTLFVLNFTATINKVKYQAQLTYPDTTSLWLSLVDTRNGTQVYNSHPASE